MLSRLVLIRPTGCVGKIHQTVGFVAVIPLKRVDVDVADCSTLSINHL